MALPEWQSRTAPADAAGACGSRSTPPPDCPLLLIAIAGLLFFSTYTLLVLFWAEIYYQARSLPTGSLRPIFVLLNVAVYAIQVRVAAAAAVRAALCKCAFLCCSGCCSLPTRHLPGPH